jgi:hypothetical protein
MEDAPGMTRNQLKRWYKGIENDTSLGMLASEHKVRPYRTFKYEWSPELDNAGYCLRYWRVRYSDVKNNSTSHKALVSCFTRAGLKDEDDDPTWDMEQVLDKLKATRTTLHAAQTKHRENHDKCLRDALEEKEKEIKDADDPKKAKKAAAAIESLIRKHRTEESYKRIKQVVRPNSGGGLQRVDVPKKDAEGNAIRKFAKCYLRSTTSTKLSLNGARNTFTKLTRLHSQEVLRIRCYMIL